MTDHKPLTDEELTRLLAHERSATSAPWEFREHEGQTAIAHPRGWVLEAERAGQDRDDRRLIVEMRNALPRLLSELRSLRAEKAARVAWLDNLTRLGELETGALAGGDPKP